MLELGRTIGIVGGGQLGRMLALAAAPLGYKIHIFDPAPNSPAAQVATMETNAAFDDEAALVAFAKSVDVVTYEFENIPDHALTSMAEIVEIYPPIDALRVSQDRFIEKQFLEALGLNTAPYADLTSREVLDDALAVSSNGGIVKTRRFGYDGKGQIRVRQGDDLSETYALLESTPSIFEGFVAFSTEISVIAARGQDGKIVAYDPGENNHQNGILHQTHLPANLPAARLQDAVLAAGRILNALHYVGVMGVEFFVTSDGLIVNEIAPRVHNSGHWTQDGCLVDQFEQHIRAVAGLPLGDGTRHFDVEMTNLIGDDVFLAQAALDDANCRIHLYGKSEARPGRKMGHINRILR